MADTAVVGVALGLHAVLGRVEFFATQERVHPGLSGFCIDIKDDNEVRPVLAQRDTAHGEDVGDRQASGRALVSQRRGDEPVGDHEFASRDRRRDALGDELGPAGHEQKHLAADVHGVGLFVLGVEEDLADFLADVRPAGLADFADGQARAFSGFGEPPELRGFAAAIGTIENDKPAAQAVGEVLIQGGVGHRQKDNANATTIWPQDAYDMHMSQSDNDQYLHPYQKAHVDHGSDFGVTLWANERSQHLRFKVMTQMVFMLGKRVLDAGCSRGDFAAYMLEKDVAYESFVGVDGVGPVIEFAKGRGLERSTFVAGDFVTDPSFLSTGRPQVITFSGTLNTMDDEMAMGLLDHAWQATSETLVFNFLSDRVSQGAPTQMGPARRLPTLKLMDWALERTASVRMRQDYFQFGHDATIAMHKK